MKYILASMIAIALLAVADANQQISRAPTGAERICINRCEAKGWPPRCFEDCMRRGR